VVAGIVEALRGYYLPSPYSIGPIVSIEASLFRARLSFRVKFAVR
jgi:hypothetical protein